MKKSINNTSNIKIAKGYRLKPSTHNLIKQVQKSLNVTQDKILSLAVRFYRKEKVSTRKQKTNNQ